MIPVTEIPDRIFIFWGTKIGVYLFFVNVALKTSPPLAKVLFLAALARHILYMVIAALSYAFVGCLYLLFSQS